MLRVRGTEAGGAKFARAVRAHPPCAHKRQKFPRQAGKRQIPGIQAPPRHNNNIQTLEHAALVQAEKLPNDALYPVAPHRVAAFPRDSKPKAPLKPRAIIGHKKNEIPRKVALPRLVTVKKIRPPQKAVRTRKRKRAFSLHVLTGQTERRLRPLARLRRNTACPPGVLMRARKP
jgi:hypothetical protein